MEINWIIIAIVVLIAVGLIAYLINQNQKDQNEVTKYFNADSSKMNEEEDELNNER